MLDRLLKLSISIVFYIVYRCLSLIFILFKDHMPGSIVVLTYHSVKPHQCHQFEKQMDYLLKAGRAVLVDMPDTLISNQHHIGVTFDDGFQSLLMNALPAMRARKIPSIIFIPTGKLGKNPNWLSGSNHKDANEIIFTKEQLIQLQDDFVTFGSHCVTHLNLTKIDEYAAFKELADSKKTLEKILCRRVNLLSFPNGAYNDKIIDLSKKMNYERVFSNIPTFPFSKNCEYLMGRISISLDDWMIEYRLKVLGAYQWLPYAIRIKSWLKRL